MIGGMVVDAPLPSAKPGLRERKKARTRAQLQATALRLFREQGYGETTVEQIAEAAEVSPTTVYRYFPTKPDLVIYDDLDDRLIAAFRAQPAGVSALQALRRSMVEVFESLAAGDVALQMEREALIRSEPELRAAMFPEVVRTLDEIAAMIAERSGRPTDDEAVRALAGAVLGLTIAIWFSPDSKGWQANYLARFNAGMALLENGFRL